MKAAARDIPFSKPEFDDAEARAVAGVLASGWVAQGPKVAQFEKLFAARVGAGHAVATTSCTTALHLALVAAGIGPGDEVICPSYSFVATANAILYVGATPVFADIDSQTWNIDPQDAAARVTARTKAILPVHQVGLAADLDRLKELAGGRLAIVEDAACAIGSTYRGRPVGSSGNIACFSFHPRKTICTGEGGMLTTDDGELAERVRRLRTHGASVSALSRHEARGIVFEEYEELGYNYRMSDIQAAVGVEQLAKLDDLLARRRAIAARYNAAFEPLRDLAAVPASPAYAVHSYQSYAVCLTPACRIRRDDLLRELVDLGISCRRGIPPIHQEPLYTKRFGAISLPLTEMVSARTIFLPMFAALSQSDQAHIIDSVTGLLTR